MLRIELASCTSCEMHDQFRSCLAVGHIIQLYIFINLYRQNGGMCLHGFDSNILYRVAATLDHVFYNVGVPCSPGVV